MSFICDFVVVVVVVVIRGKGVGGLRVYVRWTRWTPLRGWNMIMGLRLVALGGPWGGSLRFWLYRLLPLKGHQE